MDEYEMLLPETEYREWFDEIENEEIEEEEEEAVR